MAELKKEALETYLTALLGKQVTIASLTMLGESGEIKSFGYGTPIRIDFQAANEARRIAVFHTMNTNQFSHQEVSDRAQILLWQHRAFNRLPQHVRSLDVGAIQSDGSLLSLGKSGEFCLLTDYAKGEGYNLDLERLRDTDSLRDLDLVRADALCDYLIEIHRTRGEDASLYTRRIRELVGHGECIMGLTDSYPEHPMIPPDLLQEIEQRCVTWRWKLKPLTHRLRQVHGDFHPWNILFGPGAEFQVLDRSRGEWGEPADDVACLTANYLFFSLQRHGCLEGVFESLFLRFWERYLERSGDREVLNVVAPFFAFRGLVMASPVWYPALPDAIRRKLLTFVLSVLSNESFDPRAVNAYCGA